MKINIIIVQNQIINNDIVYNRNHVYNLLEDYLLYNKINPNLIVLPEFFTGPPWYFPSQAHLKGVVDETIPGITTNLFADLAIKYKTYIVCGSLVEKANNGKFYNTSALISPEGKIIGKYRKTHRYASETNYIEAGNDLPIFKTEFGNVGIALCSDFWIMEIPRILTLKGADIIVAPANSLVQNINNTTEAIMGTSLLNGIPIAYASTIAKYVGLREEKEFSIEFKGQSSLVTPKGVVVKAGKEESIIHGELDMEYLSKLKDPIEMGKETIFWGLYGRRPELYADLLKPYKNKKFDLTVWFQNKTKQQ